MVIWNRCVAGFILWISDDLSANVVTWAIKRKDFVSGRTCFTGMTGRHANSQGPEIATVGSLGTSGQDGARNKFLTTCKEDVAGARQPVHPHLRLGDTLTLKLAKSNIYYLLKFQVYLACAVSKAKKEHVVSYPNSYSRRAKLLHWSIALVQEGPSSHG